MRTKVKNMSTNSWSATTILDESECWVRLRREEVGRLAVSVGRKPDIFPVNYVAEDHQIYIKTSAGSKLASLTVNQFVAFEIDGYDATTHNAWSVVIQGAAREIQPGAQADFAQGLPLFPWNTAPKNRYIVIDPHIVSGREFFADIPIKSE